MCFFPEFVALEKTKGEKSCTPGWTVYTQISPIFYTISKPSRTILLKICMRLQNQILRTISWWHFFEIFVYVSPPPPKGVTFPHFCTYESNSQNWWIWAYSWRGQLLTSAPQSTFLTFYFGGTFTPRGGNCVFVTSGRGFFHPKIRIKPVLSRKEWI